jgi:hypothetical protein
MTLWLPISKLPVDMNQLLLAIYQALETAAERAAEKVLLAES